MKIIFRNSIFPLTLKLTSNFRYVLALFIWLVLWLFTKYNKFPWICGFFPKHLTNFGPPNMKPHNQSYSKDICLCLIQGISIDPSHVSLVKPLPLTPCNLKLEDETQHIFSKQSLKQEENSRGEEFMHFSTHLKYE